MIFSKCWLTFLLNLYFFFFCLLKIVWSLNLVTCEQTYNQRANSERGNSPFVLDNFFVLGFYFDILSNLLESCKNSTRNSSHVLFTDSSVMFILLSLSSINLKVGCIYHASLTLKFFSVHSLTTKTFLT